MDIVSFLNIYGQIAVGLLIAGTAYKVLRYIGLIVTKGRPKGRTKNAVDNPKFYGPVTALLRTFLVFPAGRFGTKSNKLYTYGLILYHIDIISLALMYIVSGFIVINDIAAGNPIPDVAAMIPASMNYTVGNILAIIFGNGEHLQSTYLFGQAGGEAFIYITWVLIFFAAFGNAAVLLSRLSQRGGGSVVGDIDPAAKGVRTGGINNKSHIFVSLIITCIIWSEILSRGGISDSLVYYHAILGVTILMLAPFTYLIHIVFIPVYLFYAMRRQQQRYIA